jgi:hypothetical protein
VRASGARAFVLGILLCALCPGLAHGQPDEDTRVQYQSWWSLNSVFRLGDQWGAVADVHVRRNNFVADPSFYFVRAGGQYWLTEQCTLVVGYAHMWQAPDQAGGVTWTQENRIYQQLQYASRAGRVSVVHRVRNEQRWKDEIVNDTLTGQHQFSDRIRYLLSMTVPVSGNRAVPALVLSDEILAHVGPAIDNTFDQNRLFAGIKQRVAGPLSFDLGYMMVYQQKPTGSKHDLNHTLRWFFYYTPDLRTRGKAPSPAPAGVLE